MKRMIFFLGSCLFGINGFSQGTVELNSKISVTAIAASGAKMPAVQINPNPVSGESFNIELQNLQQGKYNVFLYDENGKKYLVKTLNLDETSFAGTLQMPKKAGKGIYILQVVGANNYNVRVSQKMIVE